MLGAGAARWAYAGRDNARERGAAMHPDLERLIVLQRQDLEAKQLREALAAVPKRLGQRALVVELLQKEEVLRRGQESDVKDKQAKIAKVQKQLDQATSTVQVTA